MHQCWLRGLLLEAQAKKKDRTNRGPSNGDLTGTVPAPSARPTAGLASLVVLTA